MTTKIEKLDKAGYRKFGLTTGGIVAVLFGGLLPWLFSFNYPLWPWIFLAVFVVLAVVVPIALQPIYLVWMKFGNMMHWINTRLILGLLFYGLFVPVGLLFKVIGRDALHRKIDKKISSYRKLAEPDANDNLEHPY